MRIAREVMAQWSPSSEATPLSSNLIPERDYSSLSTQDEQLRLWLPDPARQALAEICERIDVSMTLYLTEFFASYLFGIHEVMRMRDKNIGLYEAKNDPLKCEMHLISREPEQDELGSEFDDPIPEMGKNIFALKIFLPSKIKDGLQYRANKAQVPLWRFARAMICAHLFGRDVPPKMLLNPSG